MPVVINGTTGIETPGVDADPGTVLAQTLTVNSNNISAVNSLGFRNRIINGDCRVDQRNAGASVTQTTSNVYVTDRFFIYGTPASKFTAQQNAGSVSPPAGFTNYLGITSSSAYTVTSNDTFLVAQTIEGFNVSDLAWGTASAQPATLSFWVRSSLTGTFGGSIATNKTTVWVMPFTYTISSANTWTYVTVAIPAATSTSGPNTDNSAGIFVRFGLGSAGTSVGGTAGTWTSAGNYIQPSGTVSVVGTNGATWYITGVQLEVGSVATPFERRDYGREFIMCQRYFRLLRDPGAVGVLASGGTQVTRLTFFAPVQMRATPTIASSGTFSFWNGAGTATSTTQIGSFATTYGDFQVDYSSLSANLGAEGRTVAMYTQTGTTPTISVSAEL